MVPTEDQRAKLRALPRLLGSAIIGQEDAVRLVAERLQHGELGLATPGRPKASFLFLGPTGVGKTELTIQFSEALFGANHLVRLDMSEYQTLDRLGLLLGTSETDPGRIAQGFDACNGRGTLLFDEIEKAHPRVLDVLLQLLDAARLTTGSNRVIDFTEWYCVLTSNIGAQRIIGLRKSKYETMERLVRQEAQRELRPELFARVTATVVFRKLDYDIQCRVAQGLLSREVSRQTGRGHILSTSAGLAEAIIKRGYDERLGARPMRDAAEYLVREALAAELLEGGSGSGCLEPDENKIRLRIRREAPTSV
jgi:ATP-dependent Clp protease ATP-binding subunit ClpB